MKVTLITGASSGIGEALANKLAAGKHNLLLVARNGQKLEKQCSALASKFGVTTSYISADLTKADAPEHIFKEAKARGLEVSLLINNAGIGSGGEFTTLDLQSELDMIQLNNSAMVAMTHYFLPEMQKQKTGMIVNVASMAAFMPVPYMAVYAATKVFVRSFTEALTEECKPYNVHVMLLCPGLTKTNFMDAAGLGNDTGKALTSGANTQTPDEVAGEAVKGIEANSTIVVSGRMNSIGRRFLALVPNSSIAKSFAKSYRKKMVL